MSAYSDKLRQQRREELVVRVEAMLSESEELGIVSFFQEKLHPRGKDGRFTSSKGSSSKSSSVGLSPDEADSQKLAESSEIKGINNEIKKTIEEAKRLDKEASDLENSITAEYLRIEKEQTKPDGTWHPSNVHKNQLKKLMKQREEIGKLRAKADDVRAKELTLGQKRYRAAYKILKVGDDPFKKDRAGQLLRDLDKPKPAPKPAKPASKPTASSQRKPTAI